MSRIFAVCFLLECIGIIVLVGVLTRQLYVKKQVIHNGRRSQSFKRGICILVIVLVVFGFSYLIRILNDFFLVLPFGDESYYSVMMYDQFIGIPFDWIPFMLILWLHRKNLKAYKK